MVDRRLAHIARLTLVAVIASPLAAAGQVVPIPTWSAPATWAAFAAPGSGTKRTLTDATNVLPFVGVTPCRLADTRGLAGFSGQAGGPILAGNVARTFQMTGTVPGLSTQCGVPPWAEAVSVNFTVTGMNTAGNLVAYPAGAARPNTSVINWNATSVALGNSAVVPVSAGGAITVFPNVPAGGQTHLIIDVNGYYAASRVSGESLQLIGSTAPPNALVFANNSAAGGVAIRGKSLGYGVWGESLGSGTFAGVFGRSDNAFGVYGFSLNSNGVVADSYTWDGLAAYGARDAVYAGGVRYGVLGESGGTTGALAGVYGREMSTDAGSGGVRGENVWGRPAFDPNDPGIQPAGVLAQGALGFGLLALTKTNGGVAGSFQRLDAASSHHAVTRVDLAPDLYLAARFWGDVGIFAGLGASPATGTLNVTGTITKGGGSFKIDHPLDPENKYLYHSFVESPDMMNVYNGNVVLDARGEATVELPGYFEALNTDFRYQLTPIGRTTQVLYVADEIQNNRFRIAGGRPGGKVSWQVTGIRQDAFAKAHRIPVEVEKVGEEKGLFLHPVENGQPAEKSVAPALQRMDRAREAEVAAGRH